MKRASTTAAVLSLLVAAALTAGPSTTALAAVPPADGQTEATIRANGFPCEKVTEWGWSKTTKDGEGTAVTCDGRFRYVLIYRRNAPVLVVEDR